MFNAFLSLLFVHINCKQLRRHKHKRMRQPLYLVSPGRRGGGSGGQEEVGCDSTSVGPSLLCVTCGYMTELNIEREQTT